VVKKGFGSEKMKHLKNLALALLMPLLASASAINLLTDGSFEGATLTTGAPTGALAGSTSWNVSYANNPESKLSVVAYGATGTFGDVFVADPLTVGSPDAPAVQGVYLYNDTGDVVFSQNINLTAGHSYEVSFDAYLVWSGRNNPGNPVVSTSMNGSPLVSFDLGTLPVPATVSDATAWKHLYSTFTPTTTGSYTFAFDFSGPGGGAAKDILVDRFYVGDVVSTPEPATVSLLAIGLALAAVGRKKLA
jgi:hypothetical protein